MTTTELNVGSFIAGEVIRSDQATFESVNPADGSTFAQVAISTADEIDHAVAIAVEAQRAWAELASDERARAMWTWAEQIEANAEEIARLDVQDMGKLLREARMEMGAGARTVRYWSSVAARPEDALLPDVAGHLSYTRREPLGVVAIVLPWNGPAITFIARVASAIACGNAVVVKPSELSPVSAVRLAQLTVAAGIPVGLVNVVQGDGGVGATLVGHERVSGVSFTGSVPTGRAIASAVAPSFKSTVLELGGKGPVVVFDDVDLDEVARSTVWGCFQNAGQVCCAGTRVLVSRNRQKELDDLLAGLTAKVRVGHPEDEDAHIGPLVSRGQLERVEAHVASAVASGVGPRVGGARVDRAGFYFTPTLFTGMSPDAALVRNEIFGPVLTTVAFDDEDEAVWLANSTSYGLAAMIWTRDGARGHRVAAALDSGVVWVNSPRLMDPALPFGGFKDSGVGNASGPEAIVGLTKVKRVSVRTSVVPYPGWDL